MDVNTSSQWNWYVNDAKASRRRSEVNSVSADFQVGDPAWRSTDLVVKIDKEKKVSEKVK